MSAETKQPATKQPATKKRKLTTAMDKRRERDEAALKEAKKQSDDAAERNSIVPPEQRYVKTKSGANWCGEPLFQNTGYGDYIYKDGELTTWAEFKTVDGKRSFVAWRESPVIGRAIELYGGISWIVQRPVQDLSPTYRGYSAEIVLGSCLVPSKFVKR
jgi:hypothetical protein